MSMSLRERILAVFRGETPDAVPYALDLSHYFYQKHGMPWDLSHAYREPERELLDYHRRMGAGFYMPQLTHQYAIDYGPDVSHSVTKTYRNGQPEITWRLDTPLGSVSRVRAWEQTPYSWATKDCGVRTEQDLRVLGYAMSRRTFSSSWDEYQAWVDYVGDNGVVHLLISYSGIGHLLWYWMGAQATIYATVDWPETMHQVVDQINENNLKCIDFLAASPARIVFMTDQFGSDVQPPWFFSEWSHSFYAEAVRRLHRAGKYVAVHIDGMLRGALAMIRDTGADCADAVTPAPMGDLTPEQCRDEAGPDFILSGGVPPDLWLPTTPLARFKSAVLRWLELRTRSPRLIAGAGDQVPPGADEDRIEIMRDLVEKHGRY